VSRRKTFILEITRPATRLIIQKQKYLYSCKHSCKVIAQDQSCLPKSVSPSSSSLVLLSWEAPRFHVSCILAAYTRPPGQPLTSRARLKYDSSDKTSESSNKNFVKSSTSPSGKSCSHFGAAFTPQRLLASPSGLASLSFWQFELQEIQSRCPNLCMHCASRTFCCQREPSIASKWQVYLLISHPYEEDPIDRKW
jgi:hypothetical protein